MPYINEAARVYYDPIIEPVVEELRKGDFEPGDLNYIITRLVRAALGDDPNYNAFNEAIGVMESAKLELYRRMVAPYENGKVDKNGDVY